MTHGKLSGSTLNRSCAAPHSHHHCTWRRHSHLRQLVHHGCKISLCRLVPLLISRVASGYFQSHCIEVSHGACDGGGAAQHSATPVLGGSRKFSMRHLWGDFTIYRVARQCCPGGNRPETPRRPSAGGLRIFWAKSLGIPGIYTKFKLMAHKFKLEFCINGWNYQ